MAVIGESAVNRAIKIGACNIYHGCVHNMLHEKSEDILRGLYKSASFVNAILRKVSENDLPKKMSALSCLTCGVCFETNEIREKYPLILRLLSGFLTTSPISDQNGIAIM